MESTRKEALTRLASIEGHVKGIRKMIEEDAYCVDVLHQTYAVQRAIDKLEDVLLQGHLSSCVPDGFAEGRRDEVISELRELLELAKR